MSVLYIGGAGRSGSTLLEIILGNTPGYFSVGEVRFFWEYIHAGGVRCGCGTELAHCAFWSAVLARMHTAGLPGSLAELAALARRIDRTHNLPRLATPRPYRTADIQTLIAATGRLYDAIRCETGGAVIVDSSKVPSHGFLLRRVPDLDLRLLHLVRDGRAVAYSWSQRQKRELAVDGARMARHAAFRSVLVWAIENRFTSRLARQCTPATILRYEDFTRDPACELNAALEQLHYAAVDLSRVTSGTFYPQPTHSVGGNPLRFKQQALRIVADEEWRTAMPSVTRRALGLAFAPSFHRFGYPVW